MSMMSKEELKEMAGVRGGADVVLTDGNGLEIVVSEGVFANAMDAMANEPVIDFDETVGEYVIEYLADESYLEMLWNS